MAGLQRARRWWNHPAFVPRSRAAHSGVHWAGVTAAVEPGRPASLLCDASEKADGRRLRERIRPRERAKRAVSNADRQGHVCRLPIRCRTRWPIFDQLLTFRFTSADAAHRLRLVVVSSLLGEAFRNRTR